MRRLLSAAAVAAAAVVTMGNSAAVGAALPHDAIVWGSCTDPTLAGAGAQCGTLQVPLDHANPGGAKLTLALSRLAHKASSPYQGVMLVAPNMLSGTGYEQSLLGQQLPGADGYDWIGIARRGLAPSVPALSCEPNYQDFNRPNYVPTTPDIEAQWLNRVQGYADACAKAQPDLLQHMKTTDVVADLDDVRQALGAGQVSMYGQSYGTYVEEVYGTLHPLSVKRMVLDSPINPDEVWYRAANFDQNTGLERNFLLWFDWLAANDATYHLGTTRAAIQQVWAAQMAKVTAQPGNGVIGPDEFADTFLVTPYFQATWPLFGGVFARYVASGDATEIQAVYSQFFQHGNDNVFATLLAQTCTDAPWPKDWSQWRADTVASAAQAPDTAWGNTWANAPCRVWPAQAGNPVPVLGFAVGSVLLLENSLDAVTPLSGALSVRQRYPHAALLTVDGGITDGVTPNADSCVNSVLGTYLSSGKLPPRKTANASDVECAAPPAPVAG
ncbi:alpha/beta fold hydrolase [Kutzneria kofuensis]|uniref:Pimeloyl-ACP methyl ester carboxylesterase n=1 Tax=Kutzneria kofuensis TaxID=103725 RepID=A0A7W9KB66_9PSEU|nr:alpha/beta fold hydrolase [Kutzneria kofuensis]MBB5889300.1 pimeloyl-ACP methyl ester carboxylesterase [Kutzneria kofuensis]